MKTNHLTSFNKSFIVTNINPVSNELELTKLKNLMDYLLGKKFLV